MARLNYLTKANITDGCRTNGAGALVSRKTLITSCVRVFRLAPTGLGRRGVVAPRSGTRCSSELMRSRRHLLQLSSRRRFRHLSSRSERDLRNVRILFPRFEDAKTTDKRLERIDKKKILRVI